MYHLQVLTPEQVFFDDEVTALIAYGSEGYLGVLTDHAPLITALKAGVLIITDKNNQKSYYQTSEGFLEVYHNKVSILVQSIDASAVVDIGIEGSI